MSISIKSAVQYPILEGGREFSQQFIRLINEIANNFRISSGKRQPQTLSSGQINIKGNFSYYRIDTESAAASDNLDTIKSGSEGDVIFIEALNDARTIVLKHGVGNIVCDGSSDISLDTTQKTAQLLYDGTNWKAKLWNS